LSPMGFSGKLGVVAERSDCGSPEIAKIFFLLFMFIIMFIITPTFVASVINSYFNANLRKLSLITPEDIAKYMEIWIGLMDKNTTHLNVKDVDQDKFDQLLMGLESRGCSLGFDPSDKAKYNNAKALIKGETQLRHSKVIVILLAMREKARPVTIVDHLRRRQSEQMIVTRSKHMLPKRKVAKEGRLHASVGIPQFMQLNKPKTGSINKNTVTYSYNIFVMLDQLKNIDDPDMMLAPSEYLALKLLIEDNDEDLYAYFEEYVETSGEDFAAKDRWTALKKFARRAHEVSARSEYQSKSQKDIAKKIQEVSGRKPAAGGGGDDGGDEEDDDEAGSEEGDDGDADEEGEEDEPQDDAEEALAEDMDAAGGTAPKGIDHVYGNVVDVGDGTGVLDLRDWMACPECAEPVNKNWQACPTCDNKLQQPNLQQPASAGLDIKDSDPAAGVSVDRE